MRWPVIAVSFWRNLFRRREADGDLDHELRSYLDLLVREKIAAGANPEDARRQASIELGGAEQVKEQVRDIRAGAWLDSFRQDLHYAFRTLRNSPGFTAAAVLTVALGTGAHSAVFGLVDSAFWRALPFHEPERLVHVWTTDDAGDLHTPSVAEYLALRSETNSFGQIAGLGWADYFFGDDESSWQNLPGLLVTSNWLSTLGVQPLLGRNFRDDEQVPGQDNVVLLSYGLWRTRFRGDGRIIGKQVVLNRRPVTIVGVLPQFIGPYLDDAEILAPLVPDTYAKDGMLRAGIVRIQALARLKPGVPLEQARAETDLIAQHLRVSRPGDDRTGHLVVEDFAEMLRHPGPTVQNGRRGVWMMAVAAGLVLLIACANVAGLLLARGVKRNREIAVRTALGCSRARMIRQLLTESTLLFLLGAGLGPMITRWSEDVVTKAVSGLATGTYLHVDLRVLLLSLGGSLLSAVVFGMIPALHASRVNLNENLCDATSRTTGSAHARQSRNLLVVFQVALGMVLLVGFGLLFRSLLNVQSAILGYEPRNVLTATVKLPPSRYTNPADRVRLIRDAVERVRQMPGVESVGMVDALPMLGAESTQLRIATASPGSEPIVEETYFLSVSAEYFSTLRVPMLAGRTFRDSDTYGSTPVAIVNRTFAQQHFPNANPIGHHIAREDSPATWREIVGVVSDFRQRNPEEDLRPLAYFPIAQTIPPHWSLAIRLRAASDLASVSHGLAEWLRPIDPSFYWELGTLRQQIYDSESLTMRRPIITLLASFGALALMLAVVGVFGITSYSVTERTREIGIRIAFGAVGSEIARLVLRETLAVTLAGLAIGGLAAFALARFLPTGGIGWSGSGIFLYGVSRTDAITYTSAAALLTVVALAAAWIPARRATRVDPMIALRHE